jgi:outer membrane protein assembly factor BamD (BamD/ComL family)
MKKLIMLVLPALIFISCSNKTAEEYKSSAEENLKKNNIALALESYESIIEEYPGSKYAADALYQVATLYQNKMVKDVTELQSLEKAADSYRMLQEKFPGDERAPVALFMSAYIKANELKNYQQATELYNLFLKKYPKHELASSASQELQIMGMSPDEVLKNKSAAEL